MPQNLQQRYEVLKRQLASVGYFRRGSVVSRHMPCGKPGCSCLASPPKLHGPYYQWTRKVAGKTVTVRLTQEQAENIQKWISTSREIDRLLAEMEQISLEATEQILRHLPQRAPLPRLRAIRRERK